MAGLFTAMVLARHYRQVTVIERDCLPAAAVPRKGVPQGGHVHAVLLRGMEILDDLCPGFYDELISDGATKARALEDIHMELIGHQVLRVGTEHNFVMATRPFLEAHLRQRVSRTPGVVIRDGFEATDILHAARKGRVTGVRICPRGSSGSGEAMAADLVVDALGRAGRGRVWLDALGFPRPAEQRLHVGVHYGSRLYRFPQGTAASLGVSAVFVAPRPGRRRGMVLFAQENGMWVLSLTGYDGFTPPKDGGGFLAAVREFGTQDMYDAVSAAEPCSEIAAYRFPAGHLRRYERLHRHPEGLLSTGDSICCLNPIYGTGITVAAELAVLLDRCLDQPRSADLPRRYYAGAASIVRAPWRMTTLLDRTLNPVGRFSPTSRLARSYLQRVARSAASDPLLATTLIECLGMIAPPERLFHPKILKHTAWAGEPSRHASPGR
jgi:2-polyprenyl-6-methoxyphenol hydroxylase-like FAD-dependent oxidoreductase